MHQYYCFPLFRFPGGGGGIQLLNSYYAVCPYLPSYLILLLFSLYHVSNLINGEDDKFSPFYPFLYLVFRILVLYPQDTSIFNHQRHECIMFLLNHHLRIGVGSFLWSS